MYVLVFWCCYQEFSAKETSFKIPLTEFLECLKIFSNEGKAGNNTKAFRASGSSASLQLLYKQNGSPFEIV
jgi:hypothetical protein